MSGIRGRNRRTEVKAFLNDPNRVRFTKPIDGDTYARLCDQYVRKDQHPTAKVLNSKNFVPSTASDIHHAGEVVMCPKCYKMMRLALWWEILAGLGCAAHEW